MRAAASSPPQVRGCGSAVAGCAAWSLLRPLTVIIPQFLHGFWVVLRAAVSAIARFQSGVCLIFVFWLCWRVGVGGT